MVGSFSFLSLSPSFYLCNLMVSLIGNHNQYCFIFCLTPLEFLCAGRRAPVQQMGRLCELEEQTSSQRQPWWHACCFFCIGLVQKSSHHPQSDLSF